jgi:hypothetical protein
MKNKPASPCLHTVSPAFTFIGVIARAIARTSSSVSAAERQTSIVDMTLIRFSTSLVDNDLSIGENFTAQVVFARAGRVADNPNNALLDLAFRAPDFRDCTAFITKAAVLNDIRGDRLCSGDGGASSDTFFCTE